MNQYGNILIPAKELADIRGSGKYDEPPKNELTRNYGPAYSNAFNMYQETINKQQKEIKVEDVDVDPNIYSTFDKNNKMDFLVGSTSFHLENYKQWDPTINSLRPEIGKIDGYQDWASRSMHMTPNALMNFYFSYDNVTYIQKMIKINIKNIKNMDISDQSIDELLIIMRNNYLYAQNGWLPVNMSEPYNVYSRGSHNNNNNLAYNSGVQGGSSLEFQIKQLNKATIQECVKQILSGIETYEKYYRDSGSLPMPLSRPVLTTMKGSKELQEDLGFVSGKEMSQHMSSFNQRFNII